MKKCYFAYTWDNNDDGLPEFLTILKDEIENHSEGEIEVIYDKKSFKTGDDYEEKEKLIYVSDSIVIFFSPEYKEIVEKKENRGVYREYKKIKEVNQKGIARIVPIIVEGDEDTAITEEFNKNIAEIFDINNVFLKGQKRIKQKYNKKVNNVVRKIIKETDLAYKKRDYEFETLDEKIEALFGEAAANQKLPHKCMYETDAYISVFAQNRRYIIGRKGSGKTTFFELLEKYNVDAFYNKYKELKPIKAEEINMERAYAVLSYFKNDNELFSITKRLEMFWEIYTYIVSIYIVCLEEELCKVEDDERSLIFREAGDIFRNQKFGVEKLTDEKCQEALFISAIETFEKFFRSQLIDYSKEDSFTASLVANLSIDNILDFYFGKKIYKNLKTAILKCKKKIIIALDGFDRVSEDFRTTTISCLNSSDWQIQQEGKNRLAFEGLFYRSMFNVFEKLRISTKGIMSKVAFCIIIPQDKLDQIKENDRDFSKYNFANLSWDAIDLLQMLIKRLEYVYGAVDSEEIIEKFERIMKKNFQTIPLKVSINIDGKEEYMHLFEYLLRISFWRPRDIIKYFYEIYLANRNNIKKRDELSSDTIKSILYTKANDIIEQEFYTEYRNVIIH